MTLDRVHVGLVTENEQLRIKLTDAEKKCDAMAAALDVFVEPECPACHAGVDRPKCLFELAPDECPRHKVREAWGMHKRKMIAAITDGTLDVKDVLARALAKAKAEALRAEAKWMLETPPDMDTMGTIKQVVERIAVERIAAIVLEHAEKYEREAGESV